MDPVDQRVKPVEVELSRNLQMYLQRLGLLPKKPPAFGLSASGKVELPSTRKNLEVHLFLDSGRYYTAKLQLPILLFTKQTLKYTLTFVCTAP